MVKSGGGVGDCFSGRKWTMKVFISWSGERSLAVANALKSFIGNTIQAVVPFVSKDDIASGDRWSTRLEKELRENEFGILSVTRDNLNARWLLFEAGALSNLSIPMVPYLFDLEPSDLTGSPLLQFQSSIYRNEANAEKLIKDINDACGESKLDADRLRTAFTSWYPPFETALAKIGPVHESPAVEEVDATQSSLEEILAISRSNQKILSGGEASNSNTLSSTMERIEHSINKVGNRLPKIDDWLTKSNKRGTIISSILNDESFLRSTEPDYDYKILMCLGLFYDELPWLYDAGKERIKAMRTSSSPNRKKAAAIRFEKLISFAMRAGAVEYSNLPKAEHHAFHSILEMIQRFLRDTIRNTQLLPGDW
jgi:hypothetical protein